MKQRKPIWQGDLHHRTALKATYLEELPIWTHTLDDGILFANSDTPGGLYKLDCSSAPLGNVKSYQHLDQLDTNIFNTGGVA